jgi:hypothetical protein
MSVSIKMPTDPKMQEFLAAHLVKEKPVNMGASKEQMYCLTQDAQGNIRIPYIFAKMVWGFQGPDYTQLPRRKIECNIQLGKDGRDYQLETYQHLCQLLIQTRCAFLSLFCGAGKTIIAIKLLAELGIKTAVVTDATLIFPQWVKVLKENTTARIAEIKSPVAELPDADVYVFMVHAAGKMNPVVLESIKLLVVDEATYFMTPTYLPALLNFTPAYTLGLCAEIKRDDGMHCFLPYLFGPNIIRRISTKPFTVYRVETPYKPVIQYQRFGGKLDWNALLDSLANNQEFNDEIVKLCISLSDSRIIIGTKRVDQAKYLYEQLKAKGQSAGLLIQNVKMIPQCRVLVGIYKKMGKGVDVKNLCPEWEGEVFDVAMLAADICNPEQFVGRVFRHNNPVVYDFVHDNRTLRKHFDKDREPWYKSRQGVIQKVALVPQPN